MKLSKKLEAEILEVYEAYWRGLLNVDMETYAGTLDKDFKLIGTTESEIFFKKMEAVRFLEATADQVAGNIEIRNRIIKLEPVDTLVLITEQCDAYVKIDDVWTFYGKTRCSSLLLKKVNDWKFIQMHISFPDNRTEDGETIALEQIKAETLQLRDAVKRRTIELENKTRDLEIEAALERVRAVALGMKKPADLPGICEVLFAELVALGFTEIRNAMINIHDDEKASFINYDYSDEIGQSINHLRFDFHPVIEKQIRQMRSAGDALSETYFKGKDLEDMKAFRKKIGEKDDPRIDNADALYYYFYSIGTGSIGISTFSVITDEKLNVLKRFRNVFDFAYRRYMDVAQAEAQAGEAQIELGLERVRASAMAMQNSDELSGLVDTVFKELTKLDFALTRCIIIIVDEASFSARWWMANAEADKSADSYFIQFNQLPYWSELFKAWKTRNTKWIYSLEGNEKIALDDYLFSETELQRLPLEVQSGMRAAGSLILSASFNNFGCLHVSSIEPLTENNLDILSRFGRVFDLTYTRFNDLKQAEAQTREAQIELALERVRARTMAMQHSEELMDAANLLFQQVQLLGIPIWSCGYNIWEQGEQFCTGWMSTNGAIQPSFRIPLTEGQAFMHMNESRQKGEAFYVEEMGGEALAEHYRNMFSLPDFKAIADVQLNEGFTLPTFQINHVFNFRHGNLIFLSGEPIPEAWDIFKRFTAVFEQTYTRFLDLQKAEAQTRDAQIQLALERVRARTMAMQKSEELGETSAVLFQQLRNLGLKFWSAGIFIWRTDNDNLVENWMGNNTDGTPLSPMLLRFKDDDKHLQIYEAALRGELVYEKVLGGEALTKHYEWFMSHPSAKKVVEKLKNYAVTLPVVQWNYAAIFKQGYLLIIAEEPGPDVKEISRLFAKTFEQTYTRFLDLQKAEAQAKESQIELALERVRARTMAMQKSDELAETAVLLFHQLMSLGLDLKGCGFNIWEKDEKTCTSWMTGPEGTLNPPFNLPLTEDPFFIRYYESRQNGEDFWVYETGKEELANRYEYLRTLPVLGELLAKEQKDGIETELPPFVVDHVVNFSNGNLIFVAYKHYPEAWDIFKRFGKVFQQTYTRFLDLQKAEAQARESQVQLAMERVRARTMAMQKSDELAETVFILFQQFKHLGEIPDQATIGIINEDERVIEYWVTMYGNQTNRVYKFSIDEPNVTNRIYNAWKEQKKSLVIDLGGQALYDFATYRESMGGAAYNPEEKRRVINVAFFSKGIINVQSNESRSTESIRLLERFAGVFEQTYTRFLDLKKVEAQAKEAKIEASLERVRAQAMSIRKSEELAGVGEVIFTELNTLGFNDLRNIEILINNNPKESIFSYYYSDYGVTGIIEVFYKDHPTVKSWAEEMQKANDAFAAIEISENEMDSWRKYREEIGYQPDPKLNEAKSVFYYSYSTGLGALSASSFTAVSEEQIKILERFRNVFGLAYRRYADVAQAEAQAREAKIEAALERTRTQSMIMQHSKELDDVLRVFHQQVLLLDIHSAFSFLWLPDEKNDRHIFWAAWAENNAADFRSKAINYPLDRNEPATAQCLVDWKGNDPIVSYHVPPPGVENYFAAWQELIDGVDHLQPEYFSGGLYYVEAFMKYGCFGVLVATDLNEDEKKILGRFAIEFERTYTRFLDLQKAEAQAIEAQIQLALERVRARTMAMQHSDELQDAAILLFEQMKALGVHTGSCGFNIWDKKEKTAAVWMSSAEGGLQAQFKMPHAESVIYKQVLEAVEKGEDFLVKEVGGQTLEKHFDYLLTLPGIGDVIKQLRETGYVFPETMVYHFAFFNNGYLSFHLHEHHPETHDIFKRFAKVFEQTYTRFLDLKKAEAQAREAQIETALEKVRSRSLAMHKSDELNEVVAVLFEKLKELQIPVTAVGIGIYIDGSKDMNSFVCGENKDGLVINNYRLPYFHHKIWEDFNIARKNQLDFFTGNYSKEEKNSFYEYLFEHAATLRHLPDDIKSLIFESPTYSISMVPVNNALFSINDFEGKNLSENEVDIIKRFARVFDQAYTRFLDLQKAEAQAREAQIETALERVRSRTMGMQKSEELKEIIKVVYEQFVHLNIKVEHAGFVIDYKTRDDYNIWVADPLGVPSQLIIPYFDCVYYNRFNEAKEKGEDFFATNLSSEEKNKFYQKLFEYIPGLSEEAKEFYFNCPGLAASTVLLENVCLYIENFSGTPYTNEENAILMRFGKVFEQAYIRFNDLKQAEAQAREAQIQLSLERVRASAMAMHHSDELSDVLSILFEQFDVLGIRPVDAHLDLFDWKKNTFSYRATGKEGKRVIAEQIVDLDSRPEWQALAEKWKKGKPNTVDFSYYPKEVIPALMTFFPDIWAAMPEDAIMSPEDFPDGLFDALGYCKFGYIGFHHYRNATEEEKNILIRFANEFERLYQRFLDLQKAEAQAREAQIEAALERVRSRTLAMHKSDELSETAAEVFRQLISLGIDPNRLYIGIIKGETGDMEMWATDEDGTQVGHKFMFNKNENASVLKLYDGWKDKKKSVIVDMQGKELEDYFHYLNNVMHIPFKQGLTQKRRVQSVAYFSKGFIGMASPDGQGDETIQLIERFAAVFNLTYTRFHDLQIAEAQTHKANIEVALERVRARALAMQQPEELVQVAEVMRHEMGLLGVEELETSSIYIHEEGADAIECWYAIKDIRMPEKKLIADHITISLQETWVGRQMSDFYNSNKKQISIPMQGANRKEWINYCSKVSTVLEGFYGETIPDRTYHLYKFSNGAIAAATPGDISAESWELLQRAASVFSLAYSRFKDLTKARFDLQQLKTEKQRAEEALTELQATQKQLIQSEKMASLGELTAGIAHEIQNPLNFVNNFSEVSKELLDEMKTELDNGNMIDAKDIANDVIQNLEKINHHGKRADAIVKGMLQHSQSRTGVKEPTNINALADEYFRLAYHGLRAKDKLFNATLQTDYDDTIGNINITPQDIGRVILNLITNAFYAVNEKALSAVVTATAVKYEPTVSISTKKLNGKVEITVTDNGNGIPQKVLDKIFQPFFTTKPTGQGTGLGLSLAYDIVKAHDGELKVETKEGEGTEFIIQIPIV